MGTTTRTRLLLGLGVALLLALGCALHNWQAAAQPTFNRTTREAYTYFPYFQPQGSTPDSSGEPPPVDTTPSVFTLPTDRNAQRKLETAREYLDSDNWQDGLRLLQALLDAKDDAFLPMPKGSKAESPKSARAEAERVLGASSPDALKAYETLYGAIATDKLKAARGNHDFATTEDIASHWFHTKAGFDAARDMAIMLLDRGEPAAASRYFKRLLHHRLADKLTVLDLIQAATALHLATDSDGEALAWKNLEARLKNKPLELPGHDPMNLAELKKKVAGLQVANEGADDWRLYRGNPAHSGTAKGATPLLEPVFRATTFSHAATKDMFYRAVAHLEQTNNPILPTFFPITVGDRLIYRSCEGIHAVDLNSLKPLWQKPAELRLALDRLMGEFNSRYQLYDKTEALGGAGWYGWWWHYTNDWPAIFENSTIGTLSADARRVYAVDDLPIPPHPSMHLLNEQMAEQGARPVYNFGALADDIQHNRLRAFDIDTGAMLWEVGGKTPAGRRNPVSALHDSFFLGPPLPLEGKLFVLNERNNEVRLACLKPATGELLWLQPLASSGDRISIDVGRRLRAHHLACADGILVCPTGMGALVAVDLQTHNLLWSHGYRDRSLVSADGVPNIVPGSIGQGWKTSAPIIHQGKVLFAGCDSEQLTCLNLRDGSVAWEDPQTQIGRADEDHFLAAVLKDRILVVGRTSCHAVDLKTGAEIWNLHTGYPSGQGVQDGKLYYLPLKEGSVAVIDVEAGKLITAIRCRTSDVPGNLLFHKGCLISQNLRAVSVFPNLDARLAAVNEALKKQPKDPVALTERALFRLDKGELTAAIGDLRVALAQEFPKDQDTVHRKAERSLFDALTRLLVDDFAAGEKYLDEYRRLCTAPHDPAADERRRRQIQLCRVLALGREKQGHLADALAACEEMYDLTDDEQRLAAIDTSPVEILPRVWAAQRVADMFVNQTGANGVELRKLVADHWQTVASSSSNRGLERFVNLYGAVNPFGTQARLALAERLIAQPELDNGLAAEQHLLSVLRNRDAAESHAAALDALARLMTRKGLMDDAIFYYQRLARDFPKSNVRDGKTGSELLDQFRLDKRFLGYLPDEQPGRSNTPYEAREISGSFPPQLAGLVLQPEGDACPSLKHLRMTLDRVTLRLRFYDAQTGQELWSVALASDRETLIALQQPLSSISMSNFQLKGHLAVVNLGQVMFAVNLMDRRLLWQRKLTAPTSPNDTLGTQSIGHTGPIDSPYACLQTRQDLRLLDVLRGTTLWSRGYVTADVQIYGDHEYLYPAKTVSDAQGVQFEGRAFRVTDGAAFPVPEFFASLSELAQADGRTLLLQRTNPDGSLRLYDVHQGKDIWTKRLPGVPLCYDAKLPVLWVTTARPAVCWGSPSHVAASHCSTARRARLCWRRNLRRVKSKAPIRLLSLLMPLTTTLHFTSLRTTRRLSARPARTSRDSTSPFPSTAASMPSIERPATSPGSVPSITSRSCWSSKKICPS